MTRRLALALLALVATAAAAAAQTVTVDLGEGSSATSRIVQLVALLTVLSLAPSILVMVTSFTRIVVVLSFLRSAIGLQQTPPNSVLISLALFLTGFVMAPVIEQSYQHGLKPYMNEEISETEAFDRVLVPIAGFMKSHVRQQDLALFMEIAAVNGRAPEADDAGGAHPAAADVAPPGVAPPEEPPLRALVPAFMISELRRAFEIGFLLFVPFVIIDMVVASVLMSMGMMMLPPIMISLPFKLIFFVLVDGWYLVAGSLVQSFGGA
ncbi:MAG: flagellar type III secretion system pore protein FliP [Alphaproteobacteria bacterium]